MESLDGAVIKIPIRGQSIKKARLAFFAMVAQGLLMADPQVIAIFRIYPDTSFSVPTPAPGRCMVDVQRPRSFRGNIYAKL